MCEHHALYKELSAIVGSKYVSDDDFVIFAYSKDTSPMPGKIQGIVVRPGSVEEVVEIVKLANQTRTPVVPSGGRAGMSGPSPGSLGRGIVVDMKRLDKIISIDEDNLCVTTQAGISTAELGTKLHEKGWSIATAYMPWYSDTVGGQLSAVPGGGAGDDMSRQGANRHYVNGMKIVLPDGSVLQTGAGGNVGKNVTWAPELGGPDFTPMFLGDCGAFGIKVEATYRMFRPPAIKKRGWGAYFDTFDDIFRCYRDLCQSYEPFPFDTINIISPYATRTAMMCPEGWMMMHLISGNSEIEAEEKRRWIHEKIEKAGGKVSDDPSVIAIAAELASARKWREMGEFASQGTYALMEVYSSLGGAPECFLTMQRFIEKRFEEKGLETARSEAIAPTGPNNHVSTFIPFYDDTDPKYREGILEIYKEFYDVAISRGWLPDVNQGYTCKIIAKYWAPAFFNYMKTMKRTLDPNNIMNTGIWGDLL